jgi:clan AA aspartic protease (TIGR02281 family)
MTNMREAILFIAANIFFNSQLSAQVKCDANLKFENVSYSVCIIPIDTNTIKYLHVVQNKTGLNHADFIDEYTTNHDSVLFATNACISGNSGEPIGLLVSNKQELSSLNLNNGNGNFYLKPNGVLQIAETGIDIFESSKFVNSGNIIEAVQSGPMLLIDDEIHPVFDSKSQNRNIRSGVGIYVEKNGNRFLVFCKSNDAVTFYDFAKLFKDKFHCKNALCLESAGSAMYSPKLGVLSPIGNNSIGNYLVYEKRDAKRKRQDVIQMVKTSGGTYDIPVELNGVLKISFIFDSGASDVSISPDIALTLIKTGTVKESDFIGTQRYTFANGASATSHVFLLKEIKIGDHVIKKVRASISNSIDAPMLLGQSVLQRIGKFTIDNTTHTLTIE